MGPASVCSPSSLHSLFRAWSNLGPPATAGSAGQTLNSYFALVHRIQQECGPLIRLDSGEVFWTPPEPALALFQRNISEENIHGYGMPSEASLLLPAILDYYQHRFQVCLDPEGVACLGGIKEGLALICLGPERDGRLMIPTPGYPGYQAAAGLAGVDVQPYEECALRSPLDWRSEVLNGSRGNCTGVIVNVPSNPTGLTLSRSDLVDRVNTCRSAGLRVYVDAAYLDLAPTSLDCGSVLSGEEVLDCVELYSMSKAFGMAGWRVGFALGDPRLVGALRRARARLSAGTPPLVQEVAAAALRQDRSWLAHRVDQLQMRTSAACGIMRALHIDFLQPDAGLFVFMRVPVGKSDVQFALDSLSLGVSLVPGSLFGAAGAGFCRVTVSVDPLVLRRALDCLRPLLQKEGP